MRTLGIYKEYIFGLLFLKRFSDVFDEKRTEFASAVQPSFAILKKKVFHNRHSVRSLPSKLPARVFLSHLSGGEFAMTRCAFSNTFP